MQIVETVVIGAGQAGLSVSSELTRAGRDHVVLERGRVAQRWRDLWDAFHLVLPNSSIRLAGAEYEGNDPDGFLSRREVVDHLAAYGESFAAPVQEGVEVLALRTGREGFRLDTSIGSVAAQHVVVATGGYQAPYRPESVRALPPGIPVIDSGDYRNPSELPEGTVLVVGSGQSGCQIAEDIREAGRRVVLSCGAAPWEPRRVDGRDIFWWLDGTPFMRMSLADLPSRLARLSPNPQVSGARGGHDLNYRTLQRIGVELAGHLIGAHDRTVTFANDLAGSVAFGDARYADIRRLVENSAVAKGMPAPVMPDPAPWRADGMSALPLGGLGAVIVACGYRPSYRSWIAIPAAFDDMGFPLQERGTSTVVPGLHFAGVPFQRTRLSATLCGAGEDAAVLVDSIVQGERVGASL